MEPPEVVIKQAAASARRPARRLVTGLMFAAGFAILSPGPCSAQVIEISPQGAVVTYAGPTVFLTEGATSIVETVAITSAHSVPGDVPGLIAAASQRHRVSSELLSAVAWQESRYRQSAVSPKGAVGVMQLTAGAARDLGVDRYDISANVHGGAAYLRAMLDRYGGDVRLALAAYNAGPGAVDRYRGVPPYRETKSYVASIVARLASHGVVATELNLLGAAR